MVSLVDCEKSSNAASASGAWWELAEAIQMQHYNGMK